MQLCPATVKGRKRPEKNFIKLPTTIKATRPHTTTILREDPFVYVSHEYKNCENILFVFVLMVSCFLSNVAMNAYAPFLLATIYMCAETSVSCFNVVPELLPPCSIVLLSVLGPT